MISGCLAHEARTSISPAQSVCLMFILFFIIIEVGPWILSYKCRKDSRFREPGMVFDLFLFSPKQVLLGGKWNA